MSITFIRVDDRMIHGQTCTRWALEYPCDGIVAVNDAAANNSVLKAAYKSASGKKTFVWTMEDWKKKFQKVLASNTRYFLIAKNPIDMLAVLKEKGFACEVNKVVIGPCNDRPDAIKLGNNQSITQKEAEAIEEISNLGYEVEFRLLPDVSIGGWNKFKTQFGYGK